MKHIVIQNNNVFLKDKTQSQIRNKTKQNTPLQDFKISEELSHFLKKGRPLLQEKGLYLQMKDKTNSSHRTLSDIIQFPNYRLLVIKKI